MLQELAINLDAVVVTASAGRTQNRRALGNDVGRVEVGEILQSAPVLEMHHLLNGRIPALTLLPTQGNVGTGGVTQVRGVSSLFLSNEPLIYVDGIRIDNNPVAGPASRNGRQISRMNDLNPEDIGTIQVVKGPAAASLYGPDASRGVIQIFTREGIPGPGRWAVTLKQGANWFMNAANRLPFVYGRNSAGVLDSVNLYRHEVDELGHAIFQVGPVASLGTNVSGGTATVRYYASSQLDREDGMLSYNWRRRLSTRANLSFSPRADLWIKTSIGLLNNRTRLAQPGNDGGTGVIERLAWGTPSLLATPSRGFRVSTPEDVATVESRADLDRVLLSLRMLHQPRAWFTQRLTIGADVSRENTWVLYPRHPLGANGPFAGKSLGEKTADSRGVRYTTVDYGVSVTSVLGPSLDVRSTFGAQYYAQNIGMQQFVCSIFPAPNVRDCAGAAQSRATEDRVEAKAVGAYGELGLGWRQRLFVTGGLRGDDHSALGRRYSAVIYPTLHASWIVSEESFWRWSAIENLRLRAAWGVAGQHSDAFAAQRSYEAIAGGTLRPLNVGNDSLRPERTRELELGMDASLWHGRIGLALTLYRRRTEDALVAAQTAPSLGFPAKQLVNLGAVANRGLEFTLDVRLLERQSVSWAAGLALATNHSRVETLGGLPPVTLNTVAPQVHREGYPLASYFGLVIVSAVTDTNGNVLEVLCAGGTANNNQPVPCAMASPVFAGQPTPTWSGSAWMSLALGRRLHLHALIDFKGGHRMVMGDINTATQMGSTRWSQTNAPIYQAWQQATAQLGVSAFTGMNSPGFINAGFAKLREISISYALPTPWARRIGAADATITVLGRNLATLWQAQRWSWGVRVLDPEVHAGNSVSELSGRTQGSFLPQYAQVVTAARLTF